MSEVSILDPNHPDLIAFYTMDNINESTLVDETGNYPGTIYGATQTAGVIGDALSFESNSDYLYSSLQVDPSSGFAVSTWVNRSDSIGQYTQQKVIELTASSMLSIQFGENQAEGKLHVRLRSGGIWTDICVDQHITPVGGWQNIILNYSPDGAYLYRGNELVGSSSYMSVDSAAAKTTIGSRYTDSNRGAVGGVDQVRVYGRPLTAAERTTLYEEPWPYEARGLVSVDGTPLSTELRLYNAATGELVDIVNSDASGAYQKVLSSADPLYVMAVEPDGYRPLVHGPINPSLRNQS